MGNKYQPVSVVNWMWVEGRVNHIPWMPSLGGCMASDSRSQRGGVKRIFGD